ncbi:hypothetical protein [Pseudomonas sp. DY-1]|uniref:hypothetical protein n=1 Tax=Pseudomonas sp. DY-1 TaxID=1755504 RepID=UPI0013C491F7|nr:hypothetical protein [Pseudomonas sp. DY-1]
MIALAELLDELHTERRAILFESESTVSVSELTLDDVRAIISELELLSWGFSISDSEQNVWGRDELAAELAPFRVVINKPASRVNCIRLLTLEGFRQSLESDLEAVRWEISYLKKAFATKSRIFTPWNNNGYFLPEAIKKNPRTLLKNYGAEDLVPRDIGSWLLADYDVEFDNPAFEVWANMSICKLLAILPNEINESGDELKFNGPPRLKLSFSADEPELLKKLSEASFVGLQRAVSWVFDSDREVESRQILLSAEVARSSSKEAPAVECVRENILSALSAAKIAYRLAVSEISKETLKSLAELRKSVSDETAKLADSTRQVVTAVAGAFAVGLGLLAAKATTSTQSWLLVSLSVMVAIYVAMVIASGIHFLRLQRRLRSEWHSRLYRFLPMAEYSRMVTVPIGSAERVLFRVSSFGMTVILILTVLVFIFTFSGDRQQPGIAKNPSNEAGSKVSGAPWKHESFIIVPLIDGKADAKPVGELH